jgi:hypothetical protein
MRAASSAETSHPLNPAATLELAKQPVRPLRSHAQRGGDASDCGEGIDEEQVHSLNSATTGTCEGCSVRLPQIVEPLSATHSILCLYRHRREEELQPLLDLSSLPNRLEPFVVLAPVLFEIRTCKEAALARPRGERERKR